MLSLPVLKPTYILRRYTMVVIPALIIGLSTSALFADEAHRQDQKMWNEIYQIQKEQIEPSSSLGNMFLAMTDQAIALYNEGKIDEGLVMAEKALKIAREDGGDDHMGTALVTSIMAHLYSAKDEHEKALNMQEHSLKVWAHQMNKFADFYITGLLDYGDLLLAADQKDKAEAIYTDALERAELSSSKNKHSLTGDALVRLADYYLLQDQKPMATALYRRAIKNYKSAEGDFSETIKRLEKKVTN